MDKVNKTRTAIRTAFSRTYTALQRRLEEDNPDIDELKVQFALLKDRTSELQDLNEKILQKMQESEEIQVDAMVKEVEKADEYRAKYQQIKLIISRIIEPPQVMDNLANTIPLNRPEIVQDNRRFKLPKIELQKFSGDLREWLQFWSLFKNIHEDLSISKEDKFQYLVQAMVKDSRASELVNSFPPTAGNYDKAIDSLKARFGKDELLIELYIRDLLKLVLNNTTNSEGKLSLASLYDKLETQLRALESLKVTTDMCAAMLYPLVESSLPEEVLRAWQRHPTLSGTLEAKDRLIKLMRFLQTEVEADERIAMAVSGFSLNSSVKENKDKKRKQKSEQRDTPTAAALVNPRETRTLHCIFCDKDHDSTLCQEARKMQLKKRQEVVKNKNACFNCLKLGHSYKKCRFNEKCAWCGKKHALLMCYSLSTTNQEKEQVSEKPTKEQENQSLANQSLNPEVFLQTLCVKLSNGGKEQTVRAIIDTGSHRSYISGHVARQLGYDQIGKQAMVHLLFGGTRTQPVEHECYRICLRNLDGSYTCNFIAFQQDIICQDIQRISKGPWIKELHQKSVTLSDLGTDTLPISLLIGSDVAGKLYTGRIYHLKCGVTAMETRLGWTLSGKTFQDTKKCHDSTLTVLSMFSQEASISDLWRLDILGIEDPTQRVSKEEQQRKILEKFEESITINESGRYEVILPWKENHPPLHTNRQTAERRLMNTLKKLDGNNLLVEYEKVLQEWLSEGIIEKVPEEEVNNEGYYLPHRPVIKENSTTRIRPVFDASVKEQGLSLNQCLETGPNFIEKIPALLLNFRMNQVGIIADIRKAFLQISLSTIERNFLRFLWRRTSSPNDLIIYRHCRVVFGVSSSPFLLGATIDFHLKRALGKTEGTTKSIIEKLRKSFYVDNCITSVESKEEAGLFQEIASTVMAEGNFELRGWEYSSQQNHPQRTSVLGLNWDKEQDTLLLSETVLSQKSSDKVTKREILSSVHKVFDPIGITSPVALGPKLLLKKLWNKNVDWDTEIADNEKEEFLHWQRELIILRELAIPRWILGSSNASLSLHLFVDASQEAYAAVIFARIEKESGIEVNLVQAKSRVAPSGKATIPRLELLSATLGSRLMQSVSFVLNQRSFKTYYWTDSSTVLTWIQRNKQWSTFVWNRVQEIRKLSDPNSWRHIPGNLNPADLPSRGCTAKHLLESRWWEGPQWLRDSMENWPKSEFTVDESMVTSEMKKTTRNRKEIVEDVTLQNRTSCNKELKNQLLEQFSASSSYTRIVHILAWVRRFVNNCQGTNARTKDILTAQEIQGAELKLLQLVQQESFQGKDDPKLSTMCIYVDKMGLLRMKSLISNRPDTPDFRYPIILDHSHPIVLRLIEDTHKKLGHAQTNTLMNRLREKYWILRCRRTVSSIIRKCTICKRYSAKKMESLPAVLPENRVKDASVFEITGIDFAGPLFLKGGEKCWICLFTCAVYRAIHLELVTSLSTDLFLEALRRFIARRGRPSVIYTDNGTNFVGAYRKLNTVNWKKIREHGADEGIQWFFNPPTAAWWGGWWERLVRSVKDLLRKILKRTSLTYEELSTVLCDCETIINSRPITYLSEDPQQLIPLSPLLFLQDIKGSGTPDLDVVASTEKLNKRIKYRQELREQLRRRFRIEYLGQLSRRNSKRISPFNIKIGDVMLIGSDQLKRLEWPLGIVTAVHPGADGQIRVARLKTTTGEVVRPVQRLYPLELSSTEDRDAFVKGIAMDKTVGKDKKIIMKETTKEKDRESHGTKTRSGRIVKAPDRLQYSY